MERQKQRPITKRKHHELDQIPPQTQLSRVTYEAKFQGWNPLLFMLIGSKPALTLAIFLGTWNKSVSERKIRAG